MNIRQLEQFLAVAETGSFSNGAARAHVSQPALSTAIGKLEADLGVRLFNRHARRVTLTAEGHQLVSSARRILGECEGIRARLKQETEQKALSIGVAETLDLPGLAAMLEQFRRTHPSIRLKVLELESEALIERLGDGRLDMVYLAQTGQETVPEKFSQIVLKREAYVIATSRDHQLAARKSVPVSIMHNLPFIARSHCEYRQIMGQLWSDGAVRPKVVYQTRQDQRALDLIRAGLGVGIFPLSLVPPDLHVLEIEGQNAEREIVACWNSQPASSATEAFLRFAGIETTG